MELPSRRLATWVLMFLSGNGARGSHLSPLKQNTIYFLCAHRADSPVGHPEGNTFPLWMRGEPWAPLLHSDLLCQKDSAMVALPAKVGNHRPALCHGWIAANLPLRATSPPLSLPWQVHLQTCCPCLAQLRVCTVLHKCTSQYSGCKLMIILPYLVKELFKKKKKILHVMSLVLLCLSYALPWLL